MDSKKREIKRRDFLTSTAVGIGVAATATGPLVASSLLQEEEGIDKYVSLKDAHKGTLEIDLRIMNQISDIPPGCLLYTSPSPRD